MRTQFVFIVIAVVLLSTVAGVATAATVTQSVTYQGILTDSSGNPLTGTYSMTFRLYDAVSGGIAYAKDTHDVIVNKGLFTTPVTFDAQYFDGRALWISVEVGTNGQMTPRQELRPVPYTLGLYPGVKGASFTTNAAGSWGNLRPGVNVTTGYHFNPGVFTSTSGDYSHGMYTGTSGSSSYGLYAYTTNLNSPAVYGESVQDVGVYGIGKEGGVFTTNVPGYYENERHGVNVSTAYDYNQGVMVKTKGNHSPGVYVTTGGERSEGAYVTTRGPGSDAVYAYTGGPGSAAVYAYTGGPGSPGVHVYTAGSGSPGVDVHASNLGSDGVYTYSVQANGTYTETGKVDHKYGLYTPDYIYARGTQYPAVDVAEYMPVVENASPGTVLIIGDDGRLTPSTMAYDTRVAGIVSTDPGIFLGTKDDGNVGEALIAVVGRVPCKVDATYGAIHPGDLLTTSKTPGHAMKAVPTMIDGRGFYPDGTILGKAMESLERGTGTIEVLVTLQ